MGKILEKIRLNESGLSLVELSLILVLAALILIPLLKLWEINYKHDQGERVQKNFRIIQTSLLHYVTENGRYPPPARRDAKEGDADFGVAVEPASFDSATINATYSECDSDGDPSTTDLQPCLVDGPARTVPGPPDLTPADLQTTHRVLIGDLPFATLGLPSTMTVDMYGGKYTYAVSTNALIPNFEEDEGVIRVENNAGTLLFDGNPGALATENAHYVVVSHGQNNAGAVSIDGSLIIPCTETGATARKEEINCDNSDGVFTNNSMLYTDTTINDDGTFTETLVPKTTMLLVEGSGYYDDNVAFETALPVRNWRWSDNRLDVFAGSNEQTYFLFGMEEDYATTPEAKVTILGDVIVDELRTPRLCSDPNNINNMSADCPNISNPALVGTEKHPPSSISANVIAGTIYNEDAEKPGGGINCGNKPMIAIFQAEEFCENSVEGGAATDLDEIQNDCDQMAGEYPVGFDANGNFICIVP